MLATGSLRLPGSHWAVGSSLLSATGHGPPDVQIACLLPLQGRSAKHDACLCKACERLRASNRGSSTPASCSALLGDRMPLAGLHVVPRACVPSCGRRLVMLWYVYHPTHIHRKPSKFWALLLGSRCVLSMDLTCSSRAGGTAIGAAGRETLMGLCGLLQC